MNNSFTQIALSNGSTEYQHPLYSTLILECSGFLTATLQDVVPDGPVNDVPSCEITEYCYGILKGSGARVLLRYIVDSSNNF